MSLHIHDWTDCRVLVTGGSGFLGAHVCLRLSAAGARVTGLSRGTPPVDLRDCDWRIGDCADLTVIRSILADLLPDVVIHLAGPADGAPDIKHLQPTLAGHLLSTINLLTAAVDLHTQRIVVTGSMEEPGPHEPDAAPSSPYAAAKCAATAYARMFHAVHGLPVAIVRPFMTYGPRQRPEKLVPYVVRSLLRGATPRLGSGQRLVDWVYVDDVVDGLLAAAVEPAAIGRSIDLGTGALTSVHDLVGQACGIMNSQVVPEFAAIAARPAERQRAADTGPAAKLLNWRAAISLDDGLRRTIAWIRERTGVDLATAQ